MLPTWVSSCEIDGQVIFLDVLADRYSRLDLATATLITSGRIQELRPEVRQHLDRLGWLNRKPVTGRSSCVDLVRASREHSAEFEPGAPSVQQILSAFLSLLSARVAIARTNLDTLLRSVERKNLMAGETRQAAGARSDLISSFEYVERAATRKDRCLLRAIGLQHFLAKQGYESTLVFGVRLNPFEAHCWLQDGDLILNDTIEMVGRFTPIRAIR